MKQKNKTILLTVGALFIYLLTKAGKKSSPAMLKTTDFIKDKLKEYEGLYLNAYKDPGSKNGLPITIGWGSTKYTDGRNIKLGDKITKEQAQILFDWELNKVEQQIKNLIKEDNVNLNQNQFSALVSFVYNVGIGAKGKKGGLVNSTFWKLAKQNPNDFKKLEPWFKKYHYNDGVSMDGLVKRRASEWKIYTTPV